MLSAISPASPSSGPQSDHFRGPPRKKMRKGTKSCLECRRRKIKCTFEPGRTAVCNECSARGSTCIDQEHGDIQSYPQPATADQSSYSLRERVAQLESLVKDVLNKLPEGSSGLDSPEDRSNDGTSDTQTAAEVLKSLRTTVIPAPLESSILLPGGLREDAPALTLFDNAVLSRKDAPAEISRSSYNKSKALVKALTSLLPPPQDLDIILEVSSKWWTIWRKMFPEIADSRCETIKESISHSLRSDNPAEVAKMLLCVAISIDQIPSDWDFSRLRIETSPRELMERYISAVDRLITSDDEIAATVDGIECMVLQAKYYINLGRPRRAWLIFHRAIAFAQLLGLHRLSGRKPAQYDQQYERQLSLWTHLFSGDRYLSMTLGLPVTVSEQFCNPYIPALGTTVPGMSENEIYMLRGTAIVAKMVERNQNPSHMPFSATLRIDQELEELAHSVPSSWWTTSRLPNTTIEDHFDRIAAQFFHHQMRALLHMPFMLKSSADKRYQYSHSAALESSRDMIRCYQALRGDDSVGPYICKLIDFQAFTAAMVILLNLLGYSHQVRVASGLPPDLEQDLQDSALVDTTIEMLHTASREAGGIVAAQSAKALEMLAQARHCTQDPAREPKETDTVQVSIPFFGTITLGVGKHFTAPKSGTYPRPSEAQKRSKSTSSAAGNCGGLAAGLPTPPSVQSYSTQQSPASVTLDNGGSSMPQPQVQYGGNGLFIPDQQQNVLTEDPFISFDSFMGLPAQDFTLSGGTGMTPQPYMTGNGIDTSMAGGYPFGMGNLDLDQSWNWLGVDGITTSTTK